MHRAEKDTRPGGPAGRVIVPPRIPGFEITRELGRGGMGVVFLATQTALEREVAFKFIRPEMGLDEVLVKRFLREARAASSLTHPAIVPLHTFGEEAGWPYLVMAYMRGGSLRGRLDRDGVLSLDNAVAACRQIAEALAHIHAQGIVHRDVKPSNILFDGEDNAFLSDFGVAQLLYATRLTHSQAHLGTSDYMAPELAIGIAASPRSDIYALGITLYESVAGRPPFRGDDPTAVLYQHRFEPVPALPATIPEAMSEIIMRCLRKIPAERFSDASHLAAALAGADDGAVNLGYSAEPDSPQVAVRPTRLTWILGISVILVLAGIYLVWALWLRPSSTCPTDNQARRKLSEPYKKVKIDPPKTGEIRAGFGRDESPEPELTTELC